MNYITSLKDIGIIVDIIKIFFVVIYTYCVGIKIINIQTTKKSNIIMIFTIMLLAVTCKVIKDIYGFAYYVTFLIIILGLIEAKINGINVGYSILDITVSLSINYILFFISILISFIPNVILNINNNFLSLISIILIYSILVLVFLRIKRFSKGFTFLKANLKNESIDILILNVSITILFSIILLSNYEVFSARSLMVSLIIFSIIMFITIQKSLQLYYKQKLQQKELEETKEELEKAKKEITELEQENLNFSKKSHSIAHKQKALEYKLNQLLLNNEIAEELDIKDKLKEISKQIQNEDTTIELTKTNIEEIDDMLKYMQSECKKNKIDFELQVNGNIHHMINKYIAKENLEILLADHIKNAIIAINHSENINRSILVKLGLIDGLYSIYIYDTGIEFEIKTLQNLGQTPSTTHADNGGTGMGFMNTFDTLNKYKASITINEYGKPSKDNYTKCIAIKFDNKNEYKITSYRSKEIEKQLKKDNKITIFNNLKN